MRPFGIIQDWVDRQWRASGQQFKVLLLPATVPFILILSIGATPTSYAFGWVWFGIWNSFISWRYWAYLREISQEADKEYDRTGKFRLANEYHDTESATAAAERKRRKK